MRVKGVNRVIFVPWAVDATRSRAARRRAGFAIRAHWACGSLPRPPRLDPETAEAGEESHREPRVDDGDLAHHVGEALLEARVGAIAGRHLGEQLRPGDDGNRARGEGAVEAELGEVPG